GSGDRSGGRGPMRRGPGGSVRPRRAGGERARAVTGRPDRGRLRIAAAEEVRWPPRRDPLVAAGGAPAAPAPPGRPLSGGEGRADGARGGRPGIGERGRADVVQPRRVGSPNSVPRLASPTKLGQNVWASGLDVSPVVFFHDISVA